MGKNTQNIILFDGDCLMCNKTMQIIARYDDARIYKFGSLDSPTGQQLLSDLNYDEAPLTTIIYIEADRLYTKSTAALKIFLGLGGFWKLASIFWLVPSFLRDRIYMFISRNRYKWFGKTTHCLIPDSDMKSRMIL